MGGPGTSEELSNDNLLWRQRALFVDLYRKNLTDIRAGNSLYSESAVPHGLREYLAEPPQVRRVIQPAGRSVGQADRKRRKAEPVAAHLRRVG